MRFQLAPPWKWSYLIPPAMMPAGTHAGLPDGILVCGVLGFLDGSGSKESTCNVVRSLGWEDPLEEGMATHSSILAWRIPMDR